jgi:Flp pilus assembly CpaF family ATPase
LAIHVIVHIERMDGQRRVRDIVAVRGYDARADRFQLDARLSSDSAAEGALV